MPAITLQAHFDGERIQLDEPFELPANAPLLVTVLPVAPAADGAARDPEADDWCAFALANLARAYGDDEPEYSEADLLP